jgi:hypothetical protein
MGAEKRLLDQPLRWCEWKSALIRHANTSYARFFRPFFSMKGWGGVDAWKELWREGIEPEEAIRDEISYLMEQ